MWASNTLYITEMEYLHNGTQQYSLLQLLRMSVVATLTINKAESLQP